MYRVRNVDTDELCHLSADTFLLALESTYIECLVGILVGRKVIRIGRARCDTVEGLYLVLALIVYDDLAQRRQCCAVGTLHWSHEGELTVQRALVSGSDSECSDRIGSAVESILDHGDVAEHEVVASVSGTVALEGEIVRTVFRNSDNQ